MVCEEGRYDQVTNLASCLDVGPFDGRIQVGPSPIKIRLCVYSPGANASRDPETQIMADGFSV